GHQLVACSRVRLRLSEVGDIDNCGETRSKTREDVHPREPAANRDSRVSRSLRRMADRVEGSTVAAIVQPPAAPRRGGNQNEELGRNMSANVALSKREKARGKSGVVLDASGRTFSDAAKQRQSSERD